MLQGHNQHRATDGENVFRTVSCGLKPSQLAKACELASFWRTVETGIWCITIPDVDDGFGDFTPVCREYTLPRADTQSRAYAGGTFIGPVIEVHVVQLLGNHGLEIKIRSQNSPDRTSRVLICRGKNPFCERIAYPRSRTQSHQFRMTFRNKQLQKKVNLVLQNRGNPALGQLVRNYPRFLLTQCATRKESYLRRKGSGAPFPPVHDSKEDPFQLRSQNWS